jgi:protoheme IX farnesyltransferase
VGTTLLPLIAGMNGMIYGVTAILLGIHFIRLVMMLDKEYSEALSKKTFGFSIVYLFILFAMMLVDHAIFASS